MTDGQWRLAFPLPLFTSQKSTCNVFPLLAMESFELFTLIANGIKHRVATVKGCPPGPLFANNMTSGALRRRPLVMLLHGWPECWYSWRHQLLALAAAGYPVCAPDMRGFGGTDAPELVQDYTVDKLCLDVVGIANALGYHRIIAIGHDFGSYLAWHVALLHPRQVVAVCGMSVPYLGHSPRDEPLLSRLQSHFGTCLTSSPYYASRKEQEHAKWNYILQHNLPGIENEYDRHCEEALYRLYSFKPGVTCDPAEVTDQHMFPKASRHIDSAEPCGLLDARSAPGFWARLPRPRCVASFLTAGDFEYLVQQYRSSGFAGGLKWYQVMDANWFRTRHLRGKLIEQPSLFIIGAEDRLVLQNHGGVDNVFHGMKRSCSDLTKCILLPDTGHWVQQERPKEVNLALLEFLADASSREERFRVSKL